MWIEQIFEKGKRKYFIAINLKDDSIWMDMMLLPQTAFLCALVDGTPMFTNKCGKSGRIHRTFVNIDWVINEWGGNEETVQATKQRKEIIIQQLPALREEFYSPNQPPQR